MLTIMTLVRLQGQDPHGTTEVETKASQLYLPPSATTPAEIDMEVQDLPRPVKSKRFSDMARHYCREHGRWSSSQDILPCVKLCSLHVMICSWVKKCCLFVMYFIL